MTDKHPMTLAWPRPDPHRRQLLQLSARMGVMAALGTRMSAGGAQTAQTAQTAQAAQTARTAAAEQAAPAVARAPQHLAPDERKWSAAKPDKLISLPADHGPHPDFRTEWWYFTGWFHPEGKSSQDDAEALGLQVTFFRNAPRTALENPVRMAPRQLLFAHVAIAQARRGKLLHGQTARRVGLSDTVMTSADASGRFELSISDWRLQAQADGRWQTRIRTPEFMLDCTFTPTQTPWLQGDKGFSRKGPDLLQASHYITLPHLDSRLTLDVKGEPKTAAWRGTTWMDHEWSTSVLDERAAGWDWVGLHGDDGSALMAFRIRPRTTSTLSAATADIWQHAELRSPDGQRRSFKRIRFETLDWWTSPRTGTRYPVKMRLHLDDEILTLSPLMPDQELDSRLSTGTVYWEGAVAVSRADRAWGKGYLELTGYWKPMTL